jgi:NAD(P)-dependent dehydrogenase (short-subunit alcohol dehydrogenase family)
MDLNWMFPIERSVMKFIGNVSKKFDSVDILINNAGFPFEKRIWFKKIHGVSEMELINILQVDLIGTFRVTKEILKLMIKKEKES